MEDFVIDEIHTSLGWRITRPGSNALIYVAERSDANDVVALLNAGLHAPKPEAEQPAAEADHAPAAEAHSSEAEADQQ